MLNMHSVSLNPQRIAVLRALQLGDLLVAVPALRAVREQFPSAEITLISLPWAASFVERYRCYIDRFVSFPGAPGLPEDEGSAEYYAQFLREQRAYHYDLVLQMHGNGTTSNAVALALGGKVTAGYYIEQQSTELTIAAPYPEDQHEIFRNLGLVALLGCRNMCPQLVFPLYREDYKEIEALLAGRFELYRRSRGDNGERIQRNRPPVVAIHPGSRCPARRWPVSYFARIADTLAFRHSARILITGSLDEQATVQHLVDTMHAPALNLAGRTSLGGLAALIDNVDLFIGNDTGPAHIACAVQCPSITIFGPAEYTRWAPLDRFLHPAIRHPVPCSPCHHWVCPIDHRCVRWLSPEQIIRVAERLLHETFENPHVAYSRQLSQFPGTYSS